MKSIKIGEEFEIVSGLYRGEKFKVSDLEVSFQALTGRFHTQVQVSAKWYPTGPMWLGLKEFLNLIGGNLK